MGSVPVMDGCYFPGQSGEEEGAPPEETEGRAGEGGTGQGCEKSRHSGIASPGGRHIGGQKAHGEDGRGVCGRGWIRGDTDSIGQG